MPDPSDPSLPYLAVGFGLVWAVLAAYLVRLALAQRRLLRRLDELESKPKARAAEPQPRTETR